jgi:hypothetical protein
MDKTTINRIAKAWLAEAKRLRSRVVCDCGCGAEISGKVRFKPGHDAKLLQDYVRRIEAIVNEPPLGQRARVNVVSS